MPHCLPRVLAGSLLIVGTACYRHVPIANDALTTLAPGTNVRVFLTSAGAAQLASRLGAETIAVDGRVATLDSGGVTLVVARTTKAYGGTITWMGERVTIPPPFVAHTERRALDRRRTITVAAATASAVGILIAVLLGQHGAGSGTDGGGVPPTP